MSVMRCACALLVTPYNLRMVNNLADRAARRALDAAGSLRAQYSFYDPYFQTLPTSVL